MWRTARENGDGGLPSVRRTLLQRISLREGPPSVPSATKPDDYVVAVYGRTARRRAFRRPISAAGLRRDFLRSPHVITAEVRVTGSRGATRDNDADSGWPTTTVRARTLRSFRFIAVTDRYDAWCHT